MSDVKVEFIGSVVAEPETKDVGGNAVLEFPVYINDQRKDKNTGDYVDTGDVTKVRVSLWRDLAGSDIRKGDLVEIKGSLVEKEFQKRDGTAGRQLQTKFVNEVRLVWRKDGAPAAPTAEAPAGFGGGGFGDDTPF